MPGSRLMPNSNGWSFIWSRASTMLKLPVPIMPSLPVPNCSAKVAPVSARALSGTLLGRDHVARPLVHLLDAVADERLVAALVGLDRGTGRPHQRADGEDVAAGAVAGQVVAGDAVTERVILSAYVRTSARLVGGLFGSSPAFVNRSLL